MNDKTPLNLAAETAAACGSLFGDCIRRAEEQEAIPGDLHWVPERRAERGTGRCGLAKDRGAAMRPRAAVTLPLIC